jgi:flavin reductase (DIM6/NTAB) family NADH-FMN oxidoreductase RutF
VIDSHLFRSVLGRFASSVTVLSARDASGTDLGMTVSAFSSVSLSPPLVMVCVDHIATIYPTIMAVDLIGISILGEDQREISNLFADKDADRFGSVPVLRGECGVALVAGAVAHLECRIVFRYEGGDHTIFVAQVEHAAAHSGTPLIYFRGKYAKLEP